MIKLGATAQLLTQLLFYPIWRRLLAVDVSVPCGVRPTALI